jgi:hypothetical protein
VLNPYLERLSVLRSAWGVLAPVGFSEYGVRISEVGRVLTDRLGRIQQTGEEVTDSGLCDINEQLDEFEGSMRHVARDVSVAQLRTTLPSALRACGRDGLLDLLDVLIGNDPSDFTTATSHIGAIDYLITLLCTNGGATSKKIQYDPVTLTKRVHALCEHASTIDDSAYADVDAEFFTASTMGSEDLREEFRLHRLRSRKAELGMAFFIPRILRAVTTYNAALLEHVAEEILDSGDWGIIDEETTPDTEDVSTAESVFLSESLQRLAASVSRRANGEEAQPKVSDGIAWALDFEYLQKAELKALTGESVGTKQDPLGTAILVGLMCRSLAVLSGEFQSIGISSDDVLRNWIAELDEIFQSEINEHISNDAFKIACALSELRNKFLSAPLADLPRQQKSENPLPPTTPSPAEADPLPRARLTRRQQDRGDLVRHALDESRKNHFAEGQGIIWREIPWARIAVGSILILTIAVGGFMYSQANSDLEGWSNDELSEISPYLARGNRNGTGSGRAFVGTVDESWLTLPANERGEAADELVSRLRKLGMNQIMIYDDADKLRIQALGSLPVRTL